MFLAEKIKHLRLEHKMSKCDLAKICNSSATHIRLLEQGKRPDPQISTVIKIAKAFGMTVDEFLKDVEI